MRDPGRVNDNQLPDALQQLVAVKGWQTSSGGGEIHSCHVVHRSEQSDLPVHSPVGLHTLEQLLGVVKDLHKEFHFSLLEDLLNILTLAPGCILKFSKGVI